MTGQAIARTAWQQGKGSVGMEQATTYLVEGAITSNSHHHVVTIVTRLAGYLGSVTGTLSIHYLIIEFLLVNILVNQSRYTRLLYRTRYRIHHKQSLHTY